MSLVGDFGSQAFGERLAHLQLLLLLALLQLGPLPATGHDGLGGPRRLGPRRRLARPQLLLPRLLFERDKLVALGAQVLLPLLQLRPVDLLLRDCYKGAEYTRGVRKDSRRLMRAFC